MSRCKIRARTLKDWYELNKRGGIAWNEHDTQMYLIQHFKRLQNKFGKANIVFDTIVGTGLIVEINGNAKSNNTLFIRPEIDALYYPKTDSTDAEIRHSCAHSVGMSVSCSLAEILLEDKKIHWKKVVFLFSPSEEATPSGLDSMLRKMNLKKYGKIVALGQHMSTDVPNHHVEVRSKTAQASSQILKINIDASALKGGHIADTNNINPLEVWDILKYQITEKIYQLSKGSKYLLRWSNIITSSPPDAPFNVLCQKVKCIGNFRTFDPVHEVQGLKSIDSLISTFSHKYKDKKVIISRDHEQPIPVLENDSTLTKSVRYWGSLYLGNTIQIHKLRIGSDDFAIFKKYGIPAVLLRVGIKAKSTLHKQDFEILDPTILKTSLGLFTYLVYNLK